MINLDRKPEIKTNQKYCIDTLIVLYHANNNYETIYRIRQNKWHTLGNYIPDIYAVIDDAFLICINILRKYGIIGLMV